MKTTSPYPSSLAGEGSPPVRLTELLASKSAGLSPIERQAGELLTKVPTPAPLSAKALSRIGEAIQKPAASSIGWLAGGGAGLAVLVAAGLLWVSSRSPQPSSPRMPQPAVEQLASPSAQPTPVEAQIPTVDEIPARAVAAPTAAVDPVRTPSRAQKKHLLTKPSPIEPPLSVAAVPPPSPPVEESALAIESRLLGQALLALRQQHDPKLALQRLDDYAGRFPAGSLHAEAQAARVDALILIGKQSDALAILEKTSFARLPRGGELTVLRGELRAASGRCRDALSDFAHIAETRAQGDVAERALYGQGVCRAHLGDLNGASSDLRAYISRFPSGRFQSAAQATLRSLSSASVPTP